MVKIRHFHDKSIIIPEKELFIQPPVFNGKNINVYKTFIPEKMLFFFFIKKIIPSAIYLQQC